MIPDHFTTQFGKNFTTAIQQTHSRFRKAAIVETGCTGEAKTHNLVLPVDDNEVTGERFGKTVLQELDSEKRWIRPRMFDLPTGEPFWDETLLAPTILPGGKHLEAHMAAYNRRTDKVFIEGAFGTNYVGKDGVTAEEIPSSQTVAVDYVGPTGTPAVGALNVSKIISAKAKLTANDAYGDDRRAAGITLWGAMAPEDEESILYLTNAGQNSLLSRDWGRPILDENGNIQSWLGINWIRSTQLLRDTTDPTIQYAGIWTSDAIHLDFWGEIRTSVDRRPDLKNAVQFFSQYAMNACRTDVKKVVKIACKRAS